MKAVVYCEPNMLMVEDRELPKIGSGDVLVKVHAAGICGTDIHIFHGEYIVKFPVVPGHEFSGEVVETGKDVTKINIGDRVTIDPNIVDHTCFFCRRGESNLCENLSALGVNLDGGFAEYCSVPAEQVYKVPDSLSLEEASMVEPLACCLHGFDRANIGLGSSVVILGAGAIGLILLQLAKAAGASNIIVSEPHENKRLLAISLGAHAVIDPLSQDIEAEVLAQTRVGADVVIESAGRVETAELAPRLARRGGTVLQFGVIGSDKRMCLSPYDVFYRELTIIGSFVNPNTHARAIDLLASKQVNVIPLISHRYSLGEISIALQTAKSQDAIKVLMVP